jgi:tetratricopeptide (TPR) repeat protein
MTFLLIALLLQLPIALPARSLIENPANASPVPQKALKDYDKLWKRFLSGKEDKKVTSDLDKFLKKNPEALPGLTVQAYIDLYAGRTSEAERRLQQVLAGQSADPVALFYLGELAYARGDFVAANDLFTRLEARRPAPELEMKRQRALLLAMDTLWQGARHASEDNQLPEAQRLYRQALQLAPREAALHGQLGEVLQRAGKMDDAQAEFRLQRQYSGLPTLVASDNELTVKGLEELGRWGNQIERFREIQLSKAITREQVSGLLAGYFPELTEFRHSSEIVTDIQTSWARSAIETRCGCRNPRRDGESRIPALQNCDQGRVCASLGAPDALAAGVPGNPCADCPVGRGFRQYPIPGTTASIGLRAVAAR